MQTNQSQLSFVLIGVLAALLLIVGGQYLSGRANPVLMQRFEPRPTDPNAPTAAPLQLPQVNLPSLPPELQQQFTELYNRYAGGAAVPALTPVATNRWLRVEVTTVQRAGDTVQVRGTISNVGPDALTIPVGAFAFRDSSGTTYNVSGEGQSTLRPSQATSFDLAVPLPPERGLTLIVTLPPDPPFEQVLLVGP